jgi:hypothetical protein
MCPGLRFLTPSLVAVGFGPIQSWCRGDQFPHLRDKIVRNTHDRFGGRNTGFILGQRLILRLSAVVYEHFPYSGLIPSIREIVLAH